MKPEKEAWLFRPRCVLRPPIWTPESLLPGLPLLFSPTLRPFYTLQPHGHTTTSNLTISLLNTIPLPPRRSPAPCHGYRPFPALVPSASSRVRLPHWTLTFSDACVHGAFPNAAASSWAIGSTPFTFTGTGTWPTFTALRVSAEIMFLFGGLP